MALNLYELRAENGLKFLKSLYKYFFSYADWKFKVFGPLSFWSEALTFNNSTNRNTEQCSLN